MERTDDLMQEFELLGKDPRFRGRPVTVGSVIKTMITNAFETSPPEYVVDYLIKYIPIEPEEGKEKQENDEEAILTFFVFTNRRFLRINAGIKGSVVEMASHPYERIVAFSSQKAYPPYDEKTEDIDMLLPGIMGITIGFDTGEAQAYTFTLTAQYNEDAEDPLYDIKQLISVESFLTELPAS